MRRHIEVDPRHHERFCRSSGGCRLYELIDFARLRGVGMEKRHRGRSDPDFLEEPAVRSLFCSAAQCQSGYDDLRYRPYGRCDRRRDLGKAIIGTSCIQKIRSVFIPLADGVASTATAVVEFRSNSLASMWYTTKPVLFSMGDDNLSPGVCLRIGQRAAYGNLCSRERNIRYAVHGADDALLADGQDHGCRLHRLQRHAAYRHSELP